MSVAGAKGSSDESRGPSGSEMSRLGNEVQWTALTLRGQGPALWERKGEKEGRDTGKGVQIGCLAGQRAERRGSNALTVPSEKVKSTGAS